MDRRNLLRDHMHSFMQEFADLHNTEYFLEIYATWQEPNTDLTIECNLITHTKGLSSGSYCFDCMFSHKAVLWKPEKNPTTSYLSNT